MTCAGLIILCLSLGSEDFATRDRAYKNLLRMPDAGQLVAALHPRTMEATRRHELLVKHWNAKFMYFWFCPGCGRQCGTKSFPLDNLLLQEHAVWTYFNWEYRLVRCNGSGRAAILRFGH